MFIRRSQRFRPRMLPKASACFDHETSRYPDHIRVSFDDGRTVVYDIRQEMPAPQVLRTVELIRKMASESGYIYKEARTVEDCEA